MKQNDASVFFWGMVIGATFALLLLRWVDIMSEPISLEVFVREHSAHHPSDVSWNAYKQEPDPRREFEHEVWVCPCPCGAIWSGRDRNTGMMGYV